MASLESFWITKFQTSVKLDALRDLRNARGFWVQQKPEVRNDSLKKNALLRRVQIV